MNQVMFSAAFFCSILVLVSGCLDAGTKQDGMLDSYDQRGCHVWHVWRRFQNMESVRSEIALFWLFDSVSLLAIYKLQYWRFPPKLVCFMLHHALRDSLLPWGMESCIPFQMPQMRLHFGQGLLEDSEDEKMSSFDLNCSCAVSQYWPQEEKPWYSNLPTNTTCISVDIQGCLGSPLHVATMVLAMAVVCNSLKNTIEIWDWPPLSCMMVLCLPPLLPTDEWDDLINEIIWLLNCVVLPELWCFTVPQQRNGCSTGKWPCFPCCPRHLCSSSMGSMGGRDHIQSERCEQRTNSPK